MNVERHSHRQCKRARFDKLHTASNTVVPRLATRSTTAGSRCDQGLYPHFMLDGGMRFPAAVVQKHVHCPARLRLDFLVAWGPENFSAADWLSHVRLLARALARVCSAAVLSQAIPMARLNVLATLVVASCVTIASCEDQQADWSSWAAGVQQHWTGRQLYGMAPNTAPTGRYGSSPPPASFSPRPSPNLPPQSPPASPRPTPSASPSPFASRSPPAGGYGGQTNSAWGPPVCNNCTSSWTDKMATNTSCPLTGCGGYQCAADYLNCDSKWVADSMNGCEVYSLTDSNNCGQCGYACSNIDHSYVCCHGKCMAEHLC